MWYLWYCGTYINKWLYNNVFYVPQMFHSCSTIGVWSEIVEHFFSKWRSDAKFNFHTKKPFLSRVSTIGLRDTGEGRTASGDFFITEELPEFIRRRQKYRV